VEPESGTKKRPATDKMAAARTHCWINGVIAGEAEDSSAESTAGGHANGEHNLVIWHR
jgi:hypothetical protein